MSCVEMGRVASYGAGADPSLPVGQGKTSWIRAGMSPLSSTGISQRASQKLGRKGLEFCRNALQSWDLKVVTSCLVSVNFGIAF